MFHLKTALATFWTRFGSLWAPHLFKHLVTLVCHTINEVHLPSPCDDILAKVELWAVPLKKDQLRDLVKGRRDGFNDLGGHVLGLEPRPERDEDDPVVLGNSGLEDDPLDVERKWPGVKNLCFEESVS